MKKPLRIKKISVDFEFDRQYVAKCEPFVACALVDVFKNLQAEHSSGRMGCDQNCLFLFGTWSFKKEIMVGQYNCSSTVVTIENIWNEKSDWEQDKAVRANKILKEYPDAFIRDFAIGTVKMIDAIKNDERFKEAKFKVFFRISYTGRDHDCTGIVYDSTEGFICWD